MPNWCMNNLTISHDNPSRLQEFVDAWNSGGVCNHYLPTPRNESLQFIEDELSPDYWYTWNISNWGTKWDFGKDEYDDPAMVIPTTTLTEDCIETRNEVSVSFNTAWSPPIEFYNHLLELGYKIHASYFEPGLGFCGIYNDGHDNYIDYGGEKDMIPVAIWNEYGLDEFFEMTEDES